MGKKQPKKTETEEQKKLREAAAAKAEAAKEADEKEADEADEKEADEAEEDGEGSDGEHDDQAQDVELIKKMIGEYMGDDAKKLSPEEHEALGALGKEAYQGHIEMGKKEDEAYQHAGQAMKLAHHMASKKKAEADAADDADADADAPPTDDKKKVPPKKDAPAAEADEADEKEADECGDKKESAKVKELRTKLLEAEGRAAKLEADKQKSEVVGYVDSKLRESGQPKSITKTFLTKFGPFKSKATFDASWGAYLEGVKQTKSGTDWGLMMEKATTDEDGHVVSVKKDGLDFSDCAED